MPILVLSNRSPKGPSVMDPETISIILFWPNKQVESQNKQYSPTLKEVLVGLLILTE